MDWKGQVAIVTGGSRGIGAAICRRLAARGAAVGINYVARSTEAEALRAEIVAAGGRVALLQADVADSAAVAAMLAGAEPCCPSLGARSRVRPETGSECSVKKSTARCWTSSRRLVSWIVSCGRLAAAEAEAAMPSPKRITPRVASRTRKERPRRDPIKETVNAGGEGSTGGRLTVR